MNNNYKYKESQFELFPGSSKYNQASAEKPSFFPALTLSLDKIVVVSIAIVMVMVLSFSLGVERGKKLFVKSISTSGKFQKQAAGKSTGLPSVAPEANVLSEPSELLKDESPAGLNETVAPQGSGELAQLSKGMYTVQVASFKQEKYAQEEATILAKKRGNGHEIFVLPKGNYSIVCVGKFLKKNEAKLFSSKLKKKYKDCLVRRL